VALSGDEGRAQSPDRIGLGGFAKTPRSTGLGSRGELRRDTWERCDNLAEFGRFDAAMTWPVLAQGRVHSVQVVPVAELGKQTPCVHIRLNSAIMSFMEAILSTTAGILNVLLDGPRYGRDLIRLLHTRARGTVNPRPGTVYRGFESLVRKGLVRGWTIVPGGRRGARARKYYELTPEGIAVAERQREALAHLLSLTALRPPPDDALLMRDRLRRAAEVSAFTLKLQRRVRQASGERS